MKIKNKLIYSFIFTVLLTCLIIWNRLIRIRLPRKVEYHEIYTFYDKITFIILIIYICMFSYYFLKYFKIIPRPKSKFKEIRDKFLHYLESKKIIIIFEDFFTNHITNGPTNVYNYFYDFIYIKPYIWTCAKFLRNNFQEKPVVPYILGYFLPRVIPVTILFIEVIFFNHINYFYKILFLLLFPLLFKIILYMIEHHAKDCLDMLHEYFKFKLADDCNSYTITEKMFDDITKLAKQKRLWYSAETEWMAYQNMYSIAIFIKMEKEKYKYPCDLLVYGLYIISFGTYILKINGYFM